MKRIVLLTSSFPRFPDDPVVNFLGELARRLAREGFRIEVVVPADRKPFQFPDQPGLTVRPFKYFFPPGLQTLAFGAGMPDNLRRGILPILQVPFLFLFFLIAAFRAVGRTDYIWAHWLVPAGLVGALLARFRKKTLILTVHSGGLHLLKNISGARRLAAFIVASAGRVTTVNRDQTDLLRAVLPPPAFRNDEDRFRVIPMGIDWKQYQRKSDRVKLRRRFRIETPFTAVFLGRLVGIKGIPVLIEALEGRDDCTLLVLGDGEEKAFLQEKTARLGVKAVFPGSVAGRKKIDYLLAADIMVQPSLVLAWGRTEGLPVSLLEGMASGLPAIASRVGGVPEVIKDGENGILVEWGDPRELRRAIDRLLDNPDLRVKMGARARETARNYDWAKIIPDFAGLFE